MSTKPLSAPSFPTKLSRLIVEAANNHGSVTVTFQRNGRAVVVTGPVSFIADYRIVEIALDDDVEIEEPVACEMRPKP